METNKILKQYSGVIIVSIVLIGLYLFHRDSFFLIIWAYGLGLYLISKLPIPKKVLKIVSICLWICFAVFSFLFYYSNHHYEKGPMFDTGDVVCQFDDRGPCAEQYIEDPRYLNIPWWAKLFKTSAGELLWIGTFLAAGIVSATSKDNKEK
jgi:energy-coupling factor transporter transmembrane protein EcfT